MCEIAQSDLSASLSVNMCQCNPILQISGGHSLALRSECADANADLWLHRSRMTRDKSMSWRDKGQPEITATIICRASHQPGLPGTKVQNIKNIRADKCTNTFFQACPVTDCRK